MCAFQLGVACGFSSHANVRLRRYPTGLPREYDGQCCPVCARGARTLSSWILPRYIFMLSTSNESVRVLVRGSRLPGSLLATSSWLIKRLLLESGCYCKVWAKYDAEGIWIPPVGTRLPFSLFAPVLFWIK